MLGILCKPSCNCEGRNRTNDSDQGIFIRTEEIGNKAGSMLLSGKGRREYKKRFMIGQKHDQLNNRWIMQGVIGG